MGIKTTFLEEKCIAVEMLVCYAQELEEGFQMYAEEVMEIVVPLLKFYFYDDIRHSAAITIPELFNSMVKSNKYSNYYLIDDYNVLLLFIFLKKKWWQDILQFWD